MCAPPVNKSSVIMHQKARNQCFMLIGSGVQEKFLLCLFSEAQFLKMNGEYCMVQVVHLQTHKNKQ